MRLAETSPYPGLPSTRLRIRPDRPRLARRRLEGSDRQQRQQAPLPLPFAGHLASNLHALTPVRARAHTRARHRKYCPLSARMIGTGVFPKWAPVPPPAAASTRGCMISQRPARRSWRNAANRPATNVGAQGQQTRYYADRRLAIGRTISSRSTWAARPTTSATYARSRALNY